MSWSDVASLIAALAFVVLVIALAYPLYQLGKTFREMSSAVVRLSASAEGTVQEATSALHEAGKQLHKVDTVTSSAGRTAQDISALTTLVAATLGSPLIKIHAFSYSVRAVMRGQTNARQAKSVYHDRVTEMRTVLTDESGSSLER